VIDTHAHLTDDEFNDVKEVLSRAAEKGVSTVIVPGSDIDTSRRAVGLAGSYSNIYPALGIHPQDAEGENLDTLSDMISAHKPVAIGEIGLDYFYDSCPKEIQKEAFREQIRMAKRFDLPIIVHIRDAFDDAYAIMAEEGAEKGVVHCFSESVVELDKVLDLGLYVSFTGMITFKKVSAGLLEAVARVPSDRYMVETDSPYLAPVPYRGRRNEPAYVTEIARKVSDLRGITMDEVSQETDENAQRLFGI
jgi:TatD DNase family protein